MIEDQLGRCVAAWYQGASGVTGAAKLSGGASQETWTFDIVHPGGTIGAILRRAPPGYGASPGDLFLTEAVPAISCSTFM